MAHNPTNRAIRRVCLMVDIQGYSRLPLNAQEDAQGRLHWVMVQALAAADAKAGSTQQVQGDGALFTLPPKLDEPGVLPGLIHALGSAVGQVTDVPGPAGRLRMRFALAQGPVQEALTGYVGTAVVAVARMTNSKAARDALGQD